MPEFVDQNTIVLGAKPLGENTFIITLFTREQGKHLGVIKKKYPPEIGTLMHAKWKARLAEQLGTFYLEEIKSYAPLLLDDMPRLNILSNLCATLDKVLPERQVYTALYDKTLDFLNHLDSPLFYRDYIRYELDLLSALGFALDLSNCAGGGDRNDLAYVSPKTGRAISRDKGKPYHNKLLSLPRFLWTDDSANEQDLLDGLSLTGYFLQQYLLPQLPNTRSRVIFDIQRGKNHG